MGLDTSEQEGGDAVRGDSDEQRSSSPERDEETESLSDRELRDVVEAKVRRYLNNLLWSDGGQEPEYFRIIEGIIKRWLEEKRAEVYPGYEAGSGHRAIVDGTIELTRYSEPGAEGNPKVSVSNDSSNRLSVFFSGTSNPPMEVEIYAFDGLYYLAEPTDSYLKGLFLGYRFRLFPNGMPNSEGWSITKRDIDKAAMWVWSAPNSLPKKHNDRLTGLRKET